MRKLSFFLFIFYVCFSSVCLTAEESKSDSESSSSNSQESAQEHFDKAKDHLIEFGIESVAAGASVTHGPLGAVIAIYEVVQASNSLIEAAKEYNEGKRIEAEESGSGQEKDDYDRSHDHDSWDRDY